MIAPGEIVKIKNLDDDKITLGWDNIEYPIEPGIETLVPAEAVINAFGDPRSGDRIVSYKSQKGETGWVPDRASEVRRLRQRWANYDDSPVMRKYGVTLCSEDEIIAPPVEITTLDGQKVTTVVDDPQGESVNPAIVTAREQMDLAALIAKQQKQLDSLLERQQNPTNFEHEDDIPTDEASNPPAAKMVSQPQSLLDDEA